MFFNSEFQTEAEAEAAHFATWRGRLVLAFYNPPLIRRIFSEILWNLRGKVFSLKARLWGSNLPSEIPF